MATSIWGLLKESLTSSKLIREAIADMILDHDNDPTSHLGETGSLQSHKASEIIDHEVNSIIADKIANSQIGPEHIAANKVQIIPALESVDAFYKVATGAGASVTLDSPGTLQLLTGSALNNISYIQAISSLGEHAFTNDPVFQAQVWDNGQDEDIELMLGSGSAFNAADIRIGFLWSRVDVKLYAYLQWDDYPHSPRYKEIKVQITGVSYLDGDILRIEIHSSTPAALFYVNGVLKYTMSLTGKNSYDSSEFFTIGVRNKSAGDNWIAWIRNIIYYENL